MSEPSMNDLFPVESPAVPAPLANYRQGVAFGDTIFPAGQIASDYQTGIPPEARRRPLVPAGSDIEPQARYVLTNLRHVVEAGGSNLARLARGQVYLQSAADFAGFEKVWNEVFGKDGPPPTVVGVGGHGLLVPGTLVEIDFWGAARNEATLESFSDHRPPNPPLLTSGQARRVGPLVHLGARMALTSDGDVAPAAAVDPAFPFYAEPAELQTRYILDEAAQIMETWGGELQDICYAQLHLTDLHDFDLVEDVWTEYFSVPPARTVWQAGALLGAGARVQIELTAVHPEARALVQRIDEASGVPAPLGAPHAVIVEPYVLCSGISAGHVGPDGYRTPRVVTQTRAIVERLKTVLATARSDISRLVRVQCLLRDLEDFHRYDRAWRAGLSQLPPRTTVQTGTQGFLDSEAVVQVSPVAVRTTPGSTS
jgi:enamine deaminase RidA (YjgF/YER057c/UK114 family)